MPHSQGHKGETTQSTSGPLKWNEKPTISFPYCKDLRYIRNVALQPNEVQGLPTDFRLSADRGE